MKMLRVIGSTTAALRASAAAIAPQVEVTTEIHIDATPAHVWSVLADLHSYRDWNPFIVSMQGELAEGATLVTTIRPRQQSEMSFRPVVRRVEPARELRWRGRLLLPKIFDGEHYFILQARGAGTLLTHGERFSGVLLWFIDAQRFRADFERMNAALKARVEGYERAPRKQKDR